MNCSGCGFENPGGMKFCGQCAEPLRTSSVCSACSFENPPGFKFCGECATPLETGTSSDAPERDARSYTPKHLADKILQSKSALEGERKHLTVLFADVKSSMDLQRGIDPEEWHGILDRFFQILTEGVHRFEGTVNQYTGDGIMALFGAPIAHENHAQRACYAALQLSDDVRRYADELRLRGLNFSVRMGLNSGEVVVGKIGDDLRMDYTAQGYTVGLAARMEQIAASDRICLTEHTARLIEGFFQVRDLGQTDVKGVPEPIHVYELEGVGQLRTRLDASRARGFSRFVGRGEEMQILENALARSEQGDPQIVGLVGDAGVGKSRLCSEFLDRCRARGLMTYETTGVGHGKSIPLLPMLRLFRSFYGITEHDSDVTAREKIAGRLLLLDEAFRDVLPLMFDFMGVADPERPAPNIDPEARQRQIVSTMKGVAQARAGRETSVVLLEDLHWFDAASETYLEPLLDLPPGSLSLVVLNFRPEYHSDWMQRSQYRQVPLLPLGPEAITELLAELLGSDETLEGLPELIRDRTGGNPFFIEEVVLSLVESGHLKGERGAYRLTTLVEEIGVPTSVRAILAARIDRLAEREKRVFQTAAVIGKTFEEPILEQVCDLPKPELTSALHALKTAEFIYEQSLYPVAEYAFKHPLTQAVGLESQLRERRSRLHADVAKVLEEHHAEKLDEHSALLAYHWEEAGENLRAARWHKRAAEWAGLTHGLEALRHWTRVRELACSSADSRETEELHVEAIGQVLLMGLRTGSVVDDTEELLNEGRDLVRRTKDARVRAHFLRSHGAFLMFSGGNREAADILHEAIRAADETHDEGLRVGARGLFAVTCLAGGLELQRGVDEIEEVLDVVERDRSLGTFFLGYDALSALTAIRGGLLAGMGRLREASAGVERATGLVRDLDDPPAQLLAHYMAAWVADHIGDARGVFRHARRAIEIGEELGTPNMAGLGHQMLGRAHVLEGQWREAIDALGISLERGLPMQGRFTRPFLSQAWLELGDASRALSIAEEVAAENERLGNAVLEMDSRLAAGHAALALRGADARGVVEEMLDRVDVLLQVTDAQSRLPRIALVRADLAHALGDETARTAELREAHRLFTEMGATGHAERLAREIDS